MHTSSPRQVLEIGMQLHAQGNTQRVESLLTAALLATPDDGHLVQLRGIVWYDRGRYEAAQRCLELASVLIPLAPAAAWRLADCYLRQQRLEPARTILLHLARRLDVPAPLWPQIASSLGRLGEFAVALEACRQASRLDPESDEALFGMAWYMSRLSYPAECILPLLRRAADLDPNSVPYRLTYGLLLASSGNWQDAYGPLRDIAPEQVQCGNCLEKMLRVFDLAGDHPRRDACCGELLRRATQHSARLSRGGEPPAG